jgi:hypothetical protein
MRWIAIGVTSLALVAAFQAFHLDPNPQHQDPTVTFTHPSRPRGARPGSERPTTEREVAPAPVVTPVKAEIAEQTLEVDAVPAGMG